MNLNTTQSGHHHCEPLLSAAVLRDQNRRFLNTGGRSQENRSEGFRPGYHDTDTGHAYLSCFADGRPAPLHLLEGLPGEVAVARDAQGRISAVKATVIAGFIRNDRFYTRQEAAAAVACH
jgi:hypothetical protein